MAKWGSGFRELHEEVKDDPDYLAAEYMIEVTEVICRRMREQGVSQRKLAALLGKRQPYIARILRHPPNMTIRTLMEVFSALGLKVDGARFVDKETGDVYADTGEAYRRTASARTASMPLRLLTDQPGLAGRGSWRPRVSRSGEPGRKGQHGESLALAA